ITSSPSQADALSYPFRDSSHAHTARSVMRSCAPARSAWRFPRAIARITVRGLTLANAATSSTVFTESSPGGGFRPESAIEGTLCRHPCHFSLVDALKAACGSMNDSSSQKPSCELIVGRLTRPKLLLYQPLIRCG